MYQKKTQAQCRSCLFFHLLDVPRDQGWILHAEVQMEYLANEQVDILEQFWWMNIT